MSDRTQIILALALTLLASGVSASAQKSNANVAAAAGQNRVSAQNRKAASASKGKKATIKATGDAAAKDANAPVDLRAKSRDDLVKATEDYKTSLQQLLVLREASVARATEHTAKLKELYNEGLLSRRAMEENEAALAESRHKVEEVRLQLATADQVLVETLAELDALAQVAATPVQIDVPNITPKTFLKRAAYVRYNGVGAWSIAEASKVEGFFISQFGRRLPVSAFGQTEVHNRLGFDHRHAMDVGLHPDSAEGRALVAYLQNAGIPFLAFRQAIPGSATGPHIHIGRPSHRFAR